ncbi:MAG TPA: sigma-70 family RNA polymerase sigma factor, partial [Gemmataceae bacterium]|nr:sigma-70 family RNA polymerase sigma factor [Gemmataceae bacterium]
MTSGRWDNVVQEIRRIAGLSATALLPDRELLESFVGRHDQAAFEVLVRRYGSMVFGLCKRILRHNQDAEDAFQATFLVLVRKAASLGRGETVGNWLYGVAYRTALQARTRSTRRRRHEALAAPREHEESSVEIAARLELQALLDRELSRLPDKYRAVIVLCDLLGKTKRQAAEELRCPEGTLSSRLAYGRALLKKRLARYGPAFGGTAGAVLMEQIATAAVPAGLCGTTIKAAALIVKGTTTAAGLAPNVVSLVEGVIKSMLLTKLKPIVALMLAASLLSGVAWVVAGGVGAGQKPAAAKPGNEAKAPAAPPVATQDDAVKKDLQALQGTWLAVIVERNGEKAPEDALKNVKVVIKEDKIVFNLDSDNRNPPFKTTFKIDPSKKPKAMDISPEEGPQEGVSVPAIYELDGDALKICLDDRKGTSDKRPTEFKTTPGSRLLLFVLKSENAQKKKELMYGGKDFNAWRDILLKDLKAEVRMEAIKAIGTFGVNGYAEDAAASLLEVMTKYEVGKTDKDDDKVIDFAQKTLVKIGVNVIPGVAKYLASKNINDRRMAAYALIPLMVSLPNEAFPQFLVAFKDEDSLVRNYAVLALGRADPWKGQFSPTFPAADKKTIVLGLADALKAKEDAAVRYYAAVALGWLGSDAESAVPALVLALTDDYNEARKAAFATLEKIGPAAAKQAVHVLIGIVNETPVFKSQEEFEASMPALKKSNEAMIALGRLGPAAKDAVPVLIKLVKTNQYLR